MTGVSAAMTLPLTHTWIQNHLQIYFRLSVIHKKFNNQYNTYIKHWEYQLAMTTWCLRYSDLARMKCKSCWSSSGPLIKATCHIHCPWIAADTKQQGKCSRVFSIWVDMNKLNIFLVVLYLPQFRGSVAIWQVALMRGPEEDQQLCISYEQGQNKEFSLHQKKHL